MLQICDESNHSQSWKFVLILSFYSTGDNGRIEYSIFLGNDDGDFAIVPNGTIYTNRALDRETKSTYSLVVLAHDNAPDVEKRLSSTVQVREKLSAT